MLKSKFILFLATVFLISTIAPSISFAESNNSDWIEEQVKQEAKYFEEVTPIVSAIEHLPRGIVNQGPEKTAKWLEKKTGYFVTVDENETLHFFKEDPKTNSNSEVQTFGFWGCVGAVGIALVSNGLPFSKILKVKSAVKALGGTVKTVKTVKNYYDKYRYNGFSRSDSIRKALNSAGSGLSSSTKSALLDFFNLSNVMANCF